MKRPDGSERVLGELARVVTLIDRQMADLVDDHVARWKATGGSEDEHDVLGQYRRVVLSGGKRLRPAFMMWAFEGAGGRPEDPMVMDAALAVELLHTFALIHDDVMDRADTRRSIETIHVAYARRHRTLGLRGDDGHYGDSVAILMGDLAFAHAAQLVSVLPPEASGLFFTMCADLMVGQYLDIDSAARGVVVDRPSASRITELKTARYTVVNPLLLGATLAGRSKELVEPLTGYGTPVGHAFQLRDDILGAFGDPAVTGKPVGDDLAGGKVTRLLELGIERTSGADRDLLLRLGSAGMADDDPEHAAEVLERCGARLEVEDTIDRLVDEALSAVAVAPLASDAIDLLSDAAVLIAHRDS